MFNWISQIFSVSMFNLRSLPLQIVDGLLGASDSCRHIQDATIGSIGCFRSLTLRVAAALQLAFDGTQIRERAFDRS